MGFRFLHTADWQLGMKALHAGAQAERVREARWEAAAAVLALANREAVDLVVLAGDTFEDTNVPRALVQRTVDLLRTSRAPVLVLPANHDPLLPHGVYAHPAWRDAEPHVRVLRDFTPVPVGEADVLPCPLVARHSAEDPLERLPSLEGPRTRIRIGVAHGSLKGAGVPDGELADDFPLDRAHVTRAGLDYLALGHWHCPSTHLVEGVERVAYCGTHEPTAFGEEAQGGRLRSGQCLLVSVEAPGAPPQLQPVRTAQLEWREWRVHLAEPGDVARLRAQLDAEEAASRERVLLRLVLEGRVGVEEAAALEDVEVLAQARFLHARVERDAVRPLPVDDGWVERLPAGAAALVGRTLLEEAAGEGHQAQVARRALLLLHELVQEGEAR